MTNPGLSIAHLNSLTVGISWSNVAPGFILEGVDSLSEPIVWRGISQTPALQNNRLTVEIATTNASTRFFRLVRKGFPAGLDYLVAAQNTDGTWGDPNGSGARDTAAALETLALYGEFGDAFFRGRLAIGGARLRNNDDASRAVIALAGGGNVYGIPTALLSSQNPEIGDPVLLGYPGAGWGLAAGYGNSALDTALVLRALKASGTTAGLLVAAESLPGSATSDPHPFSLPANSANLYLVVRKVAGSVRLRLTYPDNSFSEVDVSSAQAPAAFRFPADAGEFMLTVQNRTASPANYTAEVGYDAPDGWTTFRVTTPLAYLTLAQNADGGWGIQPGRESHFMITAEVLRSLGAWGQSVSGVSVFRSATAWLRGRQNVDGGFSSVAGASSVLETSLATLGILAVDPAASLGTTAAFLRNSQQPDGSWASDPYQTAMAVQALRLPPSVGPIPGQIVVAPTRFAPLALDGVVADPDHADSQLLWNVTGGTQITVSLSNRVAHFSYVPGRNTNAISERLTFTAIDPDGASGSAAGTFVISANHPPVVGPIPGQSVGAPGSFAPIHLDDYVYDPEESTNEIAWSVTGNTLLAITLSNRIVTIRYQTNITTPITETLTFTATDLVGWTASTNATFSVAPNRPPVVSPIPNQTVTAPYPFTAIVLDNYVADPDDSDSRITWQVTGNVRLSVSIANRIATITYSGSPTNSISEQLTFTARDPVGFSASTTATFTVSPNRPPAVSPIPGQTVTSPYPFTPIALDNYVSDPDEPDSEITWRITGNSRLVVAISNRVVTLTYNTSATTFFTEQLTFTATDPVGLSNSTTATFSVSSNRPPVVSPIPAQTNSAPYPFTPVALDNYVADPEEPDSNMTWSVSGNSRFAVTLSNRVAYVAYPVPVTTNIIEQLTFRSTDAVVRVDSTTTTFVIRSNRPPVVSPIPSQTNEVPVPFPSIALDDYVADPDEPDNQITWTVSGQTRFAVNIANRIATITYPADTTNSFSELLTFRATDPQGNFGSTTSRFAVVYSPPDYTIARGASVTDSRTFSTSVENWNTYVYRTNNVFPLLSTVTVINLSYTDVPPASVRASYRISATLNTVPGTYPIRVSYGLEDDNGIPLVPLTNNVYNFRIKVTP